MKTINRRIIICLIGIIGVLALTGCDAFIKTNKGKVDPYWYMNLTEENEAGEDVKIESSDGETVAVATDSDYSMEYGLKVDDDVFVNIATVKEYISDAFHWDKVDKKFLYTDATTISVVSANNPLSVKKGDASAISGETSSEKLGYQIVLVSNKQAYVNVKYLQKILGIKYKFINKKEKYPSVLNISNSADEYKTATIDSDIEIRTKGNYQNLIVDNAKEDEKVVLIEKGENWSKIKTAKGIIGFVPTKYIEDIKTNKSSMKDVKSNYTHIKHDGEIKMVWHAVYAITANAGLKDKIKNVQGINVISPTWFTPSDGNGGLKSIGTEDYVKTAHKNGMEVWALVEDISMKKESARMLSSTNRRFAFINNLMNAADDLGVDGINVDFEYITKDTAADYREFLRELSVACRQEHFVLSIDNYPTEEDTYYDIEQQSLLADYIVSMSYDEHNVNSKEAGSVASIDYTKNAIKAMVKHVGDASRVINASPFYTRLWDITPEGKGSDEGVFVEDAANGNYYLTSQVLGMKWAEKVYKKAGVKPTLDKETGQNYVVWEEGDVTRQMWLEDEMSVEKRVELARSNKLAGTAFWALGFEKDSIWKEIK